MSPDMLDLLRLDAGTRTLGQLLQEREWAYGEITRLRQEVQRQIHAAKSRPPSEVFDLPVAFDTCDCVKSVSGWG